MNEATFESTLHAVLDQALSTFAGARITHQTNLTLRLGHYSVVTKGDLKKKAQGRLDVLVKVDEKPALLLELKAPGRGILSEDVEQARSYARLLNPMPPLFGVSDGQATRFFRTFDSTEWQGTTLDEQQLQGLLDDALACAAADHDNAVRSLLGRKPSLWVQVLRRETEAALAALEGDVADFSRPLATSFSAPRAAVADRLQAALEEKEVVVLTGPPLSGKTNVLAEMCRLQHANLVPLYIDAGALSHGVWQHLSNLFSLRLLRATSAEDARQWIWGSLRDLSGPRPVLVIDGWQPGVNDKVRADLDEIVGRLPLGGLRIVLALDDSDFEILTRVPGRTTKTALGRAAKQIRLNLLADTEFEEAIGVLHEKHGASFYAGAQHNRELRSPRLLRLHAALTTGRNEAPADLEPPRPGMSMTTLLPPITSVGIVTAAWEYFTSDNQELRADLARMATAWLTVPPPVDAESAIAFEQLGRCALSLDALEQALSGERLRRLRQQGYLRPLELPSGQFMVMRLPELLAAAAIAVITKRFVAEPDLAAAYTLFLRETQRFPLADVIGAAVLLRSAESVRLVNGVLMRLLDDEPIVTSLTGKSVALVTGEGAHSLPRSEDDENQQTFANLHPALVLSHLSAFPMMRDGDRDQTVEARSPNALIIAKVGSFPHLLRRIDTVPVREMRPIMVHHGGGLTVVCHNEGIVEPIVQSMLFHLMREPDETAELAQWAVKSDRPHLVWRLRIAASLASTVTDRQLAAKATEIDRLCLQYWSERFDRDAH